MVPGSNTTAYLLAALAMTLALTGCDSNKAGIKFVDIPAGDYIMGGCRKAEDCLEGSPEDVWIAETPQRRVSVKAFQLAQTEVTFGQFKRFINDTKKPMSEDVVKYNIYGDDAPVTAIPRSTAREFAEWLNRSKPSWAFWDKSVYRLPSEAEWEYACRAGTGHAHSFCGGNNLGEIAWYQNNSNNRLHPVATKKANAWGLFDMSGNVAELTDDCYVEKYTNAPADGSAVLTADCDWGVSRGGSQDNGKPEDNLRAGRRSGHAAEEYGFTGFRIARTVSP